MAELFEFKKKELAPQLTVNSDAIELCKELLERLISGESVAVAIVEVFKDNHTVATAYSGSEHYHALCSGVARLNARIALD